MRHRNELILRSLSVRAGPVATYPCPGVDSPERPNRVPVRRGALALNLRLTLAKHCMRLVHRQLVDNPAAQTPAITAP